MGALHANPKEVGHAPNSSVSRPDGPRHGSTVGSWSSEEGDHPRSDVRIRRSIATGRRNGHCVSWLRHRPAGCTHVAGLDQKILCAISTFRGRECGPTRARPAPSHECRLPWIDDCPETKQFVKYWFASRQRLQLRRLSYVLTNDRNRLPSHIRECLLLALSRIIVTKHAGASLAWDVSHSRPHKVRDENDFDVDAMFLQSTARLVQLLGEQQSETSSRVRNGDCRTLAKSSAPLY